MHFWAESMPEYSITSLREMKISILVSLIINLLLDIFVKGYLMELALLFSPKKEENSRLPKRWDIKINSVLALFKGVILRTLS
jgi:hypothetical protein